MNKNGCLNWALCYFWWIETSVFFFRVKNNCGDKQFCLSVETNDSGATLINQWISSLFFVHRSLRLVFQNWINEMLKWKFLMWQWNRWVTFTFTARWTSWNIVIRTWRLFLGQARLIYDWRARSREKELVKKSSYIPLKETPLFPSHQYKRNHFCFHTFYLCTCVFLELDQMIDWQLRSVTLPLDNVTKLRSEWFFSSDSIDRTGHFFPMPIRKDEKDSRSKRGRKWIDCVIFQIIKHRNVFCLGSHQDILTCPTKSTGASYDTIKHGSSYCLSLPPAFCFF